MHRDNVPIAPGESWDFQEMQGPGKIINFCWTAMPAVDFNIAEGKISIG
jgi:hypothetical protein